MCHAASGVPLGWLEGLEHDAPTRVAAETGSGGDDLRLTFASGAVAEVQVKRGLRDHAKLWAALEDLADALHADKAQWGLLLVSPNTTGTIKHALAADLITIGEGGGPSPDSLGARWVTRLMDRGQDPTAICKRLRIVTIAAQAVEAADVRAARALLAALCRAPADAAHGWNGLYSDAHKMIELRGRRSRADIAQTLRSCGIALRQDVSAPAGLLQRLCDWTLQVNRSFTILGLDRPLPIDEVYIDLEPYVPGEEAAGPADLAAAVAVYHDWTRRLPGQGAITTTVDALGRFYRRGVVVAGPGAGKSTLMARLARAYARDGLPVLKVSALVLARRLSARGETFLDAILALGLQGSAVTPAQALGAGLDDWVILLDGLDEAGPDQATLAQRLTELLATWPDLRVIVTTRPVGYRPALFEGWRHYALPSLGGRHDTTRCLVTLLGHILPAADPRRATLNDTVSGLIETSGLDETTLRTPLMVGLAAAIHAGGGQLGGARPAFYRAVFDLLEREPPVRAGAPPSTPSLRAKFLDALGWTLTASPKILAEEALDACAQHLAAELEWPILRTRHEADAICAYWESLGVIERLRHAGDTALAFVHKTFGEFAAGRYLAQSAPQTRRAFIAAHLDDPAWAEPLAFAAAISGGTGPILERLASLGYDDTPAGRARVSRAMNILAAAAPVPDEAQLTPVLDAAFAQLTSTRQHLALAVGGDLYALGAAYGPALAARARTLLGHPQDWTRLVAHAICEKADPALFSLAAWIDALREFAALVGEAREDRLLGDDVPTEPVRALLGAFALRVVKRAVEDKEPGEAQAFLDEVTALPGLWNGGRMVQLERFLAGRSLQARWGRATESGQVWPDPDKVYGAMRRTFVTIMRGVAQGRAAKGNIPGPTKGDQPLFCLAAFFTQIGFHEVGLSELWSVEHYGADADVRWLWRTIVQLSGLPAERVFAEAARHCAALGAYKGDRFIPMVEQLPKVDVPPISWISVSTLPIDRAQLEAVLNRPSGFVVEPALKIALHLDDAAYQEDLARRLLATGKGVTLWAASELAAHLPTPTAEPLLLEAAQEAPRPGFEYLFEALQGLDAPPGPHALPALTTSLLSTDAEAATAAGVYLCKAPHPDFAPLLKTAWTHWLAAEATYTTDVVGRPVSPRAALLTAMIALAPKTAPELVTLHDDPREEVQAVARTALVSILKTEAADRAAVAQEIGAGRITPHLTERLLRGEIPFSRDDVLTMLDLLEDPDERLRLAALRVLDCPGLETDERRARLVRLRDDPRAEIREAVARRLERLDLSAS